jgi:hypothetical protein
MVEVRHDDVGSNNGISGRGKKKRSIFFVFTPGQRMVS